MSLLINFFVLILVQIHFVWFCSCRLCVSRGLPSEAATIHSLLSLSVLSFLSCFWCWFCVWFSYPCLCMLVVIMLIEGVIPKAEEIEELNWRSVAMDKKNNIFFIVLPSGCVCKNVSVGKQDSLSFTSTFSFLWQPCCKRSCSFC